MNLTESKINNKPVTLHATIYFKNHLQFECINKYQYAFLTMPVIHFPASQEDDKITGNKTKGRDDSSGDSGRPVALHQKCILFYLRNAYYFQKLTWIIGKILLRITV